MTTPVQALTGLGLIALGLPVYYFFFKHRRVVDTQSATGEDEGV